MIVGAGIGGLALARRLGSLGVKAEILERRPRGEARGAGILLTGNAVRALDDLGLALPLREGSRRVNAIRFTDERQRGLFEIKLSARPGWPAFLSVQRDTLQQILLDAARPVVPLWSTTLGSLDEREDGIEVEFSSGARHRFDLVVGADGVHSQLRKLLFDGPPVKPIAGLCGWRFLAQRPRGLEAPQYMLGNGGTMLLHPLPADIVYCGAGPVVEAGVEGGNDLARMRNAFAAFGGFAAEILAELGEPTPLIATRYWHVEQRPWHAGRCVLIGDAAHACAPTLAQGGAMALEDALVLGDLLGGQASLAVALREFEARRAPRVAHAQLQSLQRMAVNRLLDARALALRNSVLSKMGGTQLLDAWAPLMERSP